jgi:hypothetical protein
MSIRKLPIALAAATLAIAPLAVQAAPVERAAAPTAEESQLRDGSLLWIAAIIAVIVGAILLFDDDNDPVSP